MKGVSKEITAFLNKGATQTIDRQRQIISELRAELRTLKYKISQKRVKKVVIKVPEIKFVMNRPYERFLLMKIKNLEDELDVISPQSLMKKEV